jgi:hypothetical protein
MQQQQGDAGAGRPHHRAHGGQAREESWPMASIVDDDAADAAADAPSATLPAPALALAPAPVVGADAMEGGGGGGLVVSLEGAEAAGAGSGGLGPVAGGGGGGEFAGCPWEQRRYRNALNGHTLARGTYPAFG